MRGRNRAAERQQAPTSEEVIAKRIDRLAARKLWFGIVWKILIVVLAFWLLLSFVYGMKIVEDDSMASSLLDGDLTFFYRLDKDYLADDVVAYTDENGQTAYARIVGVPGDQVSFDEYGVLHVNGNIKALDGEMITAEDMAGLDYSYQVPQGSYYLLNDNLSNTSDSRTLGAIESSRLEGKIIQLLRRRNF